VVFILWHTGIVQAQRSWEEIPNYDGLQVANGMLVFSDKSAFDQVYADLEQRVQGWNADAQAEAPEASSSEPCPDDNTVLASFEQQYGHASIRRAALLRECEWLDRGNDPLDFEDHYLVDDILGSLFNEKYQLQVGSDIYYLPRPDITYIVAGADLQTLAALERGSDPHGFSNVKVYGPESGCQADFSVNTNNSSTTVGFAFTGQPQVGNVNYFWEFGDGSVSMLKNPVHTYATQGQYTVCLTVESTGHMPCVSRICKTVQVGASCQPWFTFTENGQPGGLCFLDISQFLGNVISWKWNFGDGSPESNESSPCHVFPCDNLYYVSLTVQTSAGCTSTITLPVQVDSYNCCSRRASTKGNHYYSENQRRIKYQQYQLQIPVLYHRTIAKMKHYRLKSNGKWTKDKALLQIDLLGEVFLSSETGCKCQNPFNIANTKLAYNKKSLTITKGVGDWFKAKKDHEWRANYYVNNKLLTQKTTPVNCD
jgi:PKD repeat protein